MNVILDLLFPKSCVNCNKGGTYFCPKCVQTINQSELVCPMCERYSLGGITHPMCKRRWGMDGLWFLGVYEKPLKPAIQKLKYKWITDFAEILVNIMLEYWAKNPPLIFDHIKKDRGVGWLVIPVPLHKRRQNWRGFNQSALLGKLIAQKLGLNYKDCLLRIKHTKPQMSLKSEERHSNIRNAFILNQEYDVSNKKVLLIDDVWTTGSTLKECSAILKKSTVISVWGITIAR